MNYLEKYLSGSIPPGNRNSSLFTACMCAREEGMHPDEIRHVLTQKALADGLSMREIQTTIESAMRRPVAPLERKQYKSGKIPIAWNAVLDAEKDVPPIPHATLMPSPNWATWDIQRFLDAAFQPDDIVCFVTKYAMSEDGIAKPADAGVSMPAKKLKAKCASGAIMDAVHADDAAGAWIRINPMDGKGGKDSNVSDFRHVLVESDSMPVKEQWEKIRQLQLPCSVVIHSGGKSIHAWVRVDAGQDRKLYDERAKRLYEYLEANGFPVDKQNKNPSRLSRLPSVTRNGIAQYLVSGPCGKESWGAWEAFTRKKEEKKVWERQDFSNWLALSEEPVPWLFEDCVPDKTITVVGAQGGIGKSMFALGLALSVVTGKYVFDSFVPSTKGAVMLLAGEESLAMVARRVRSYADQYHMDYQELSKDMELNLHVRALESFPMLHKQLDGTMTTTEEYDLLLEGATRIQPKLIIIDTARKFAGIINEIDNTQVGAFMEACAQLAKIVDCTVIVLHHSSKIAADKGDAKVTDLRGGTAFGDESRCCWIMKRAENGQISLTNEKQSYGRLHPAVSLDFAYDGALVEIDPDGTESARIISEVEQAAYSWLATHPDEDVSQADVCKHFKKSKAAAEMRKFIFDNVDQCTSELLKKGVESAMLSGVLAVYQRTAKNGRPKHCLIPGNRDAFKGKNS